MDSLESLDKDKPLVRYLKHFYTFLHMRPLTLREQKEEVQLYLKSFAMSSKSTDYQCQMWALRRLRDALRHGSRHTKELAKINMRRLPAFHAYRMTRRGLHVGFLSELRIKRLIAFGEAIRKRDAQLYKNHNVAKRMNHV